MPAPESAHRIAVRTLAAAQNLPDPGGQQSLPFTLSALLDVLQGGTGLGLKASQSVEQSLNNIFPLLAVDRPRNATLIEQLRAIEANLP